MWKPSSKTGTLFLLASILTLGNVACSSDTPESSPSPSASPVSKSQATPKAVPPTPSKPAASSLGDKPPTAAKTVAQKPPTAAKTVAQKSPTTAKTGAQKPSTTTKKTSENPDTTTPDTYGDAIDTATGAISISKSAVSRDDWSLVANQWQQAIQLLKKVPASSSNHAIAQKKLPQYQGFLADAKLKAAPPPKKTQSGDINPQFFSVPIKGRIGGGTPIVEVTFNGTRKFEMLFDTGATSTLITRSMAYSLQLKPIGLMKVTVADGATLLLYVASLKSLEVDGRIKRKMQVAVAPPAADVGLLGQDFYEGYDITIKQDIIEFRKR